MRVKLTHGRSTQVVLRLQPRGTERLGEWYTLYDLVFGNSTREGTPICALPAVREKVDEFVASYMAAKKRRDPHLLAKAYTAAAEAFTRLGIPQEATRWRQKAAEQAERAKNIRPAVAKSVTEN